MNKKARTIPTKASRLASANGALDNEAACLSLALEFALDAIAKIKKGDLDDAASCLRLVANFGQKYETIRRERVVGFRA